MRARAAILAAAILFTGWGAAEAEPRLLTFPIDLDCPVSEPPLFEIVLGRQPGVLSVEVRPDDAVVLVIYENTLTDKQALIDALVDSVLGEMLGADPITEGPAP